MNTQELVRAIRQLIYDRFTVPVFHLKGTPNGKLVITDSAFRIKDSSYTGSVTSDVTIKQEDDLYFAPFTGDNSFAYLEEFLLDLVDKDFPIAYGGYFRGTEPTKLLAKLKGKEVSQDSPIFTRHFYSDETIINFCLQYFADVLRMDKEVYTPEQMEVALAEFQKKTYDHMVLYVAIMLVEFRLLAEYKASISGIYFTDGSGEMMAGNLGSLDENISVNIGSVFSLSDASPSGNEYFSENWNLPGSDNILGNKDSFWFKLFCHLRDQLEQRYKDYTFRKDVGIWSQIILEKPLNYRTYYDSYPWTISPQPRYIIK